MSLIAPSARVAAHGLAVHLPSRWEARIYLRDTPTDPPPLQNPPTAPLARLAAAVRANPGAYGWDEERPHPVLHAATFALPPRRGDFGTGAVELMRSRDVFVALLEFGESEAGTPLFAHRGVPYPTAEQFSPSALQRRLAGQAGVQRFFTERNRAMCLYVVLGSHRHRADLVPTVHELLDGLEVSDR